MKIKSYSVCGPCEGLVKQNAIWVQGEDATGLYPLIYLQRPKWIKSDDAWKKICESVKLDLPKDFEVE